MIFLRKTDYALHYVTWKRDYRLTTERGDLYTVRFTFADSVQARDEVIVAHYSEAQERIDSDQNVYYESAVFSSLRAHQRSWKLFYGGRRTIGSSRSHGRVRIRLRHIGRLVDRSDLKSREIKKKIHQLLLIQKLIMRIYNRLVNHRSSSTFSPPDKYPESP